MSNTIITQILAQCARAHARGSWLGLNPPEFDVLLLTAQRRLIIFAYFVLVNLSTYCKYHGMNVYANFKEHCKWDKK